AIGVAGVDRREVDAGSDAGVEGVRSGHDLTLEPGELAPHLAHHHVAHGEPDFGVDGVDGPRTGDVARDGGGGGGGGGGNGGGHCSASSALLTYQPRQQG